MELGRWFGAPREVDDTLDTTEGVQTRRQHQAAQSESTSRPKDVQRLQTPQDLIRSRSRGNSPASSPRNSPLQAETSNDDAFTFPANPTPNIMDDEQVQRIMANAIRIALQ